MRAHLRRLRLAAALLALAGCAPRDAVFARPGVTGAPRRGTPVWARTDPDDTCFMRHSGSEFFPVRRMNGDEVRLHEGDASSTRTISVRPSDVIFPENVPRGALSTNNEFSECPSIVRVLELDLDRKRAVLDCGGFAEGRRLGEARPHPAELLPAAAGALGYALALWLWVICVPLSIRLLRAGATRRRLAAIAAKFRPDGKSSAIGISRSSGVVTVAGPCRSPTGPRRPARIAPGRWRCPTSTSHWCARARS